MGWCTDPHAGMGCRTLRRVCFLLLLFRVPAADADDPPPSPEVFDVESFGAVGDGETDNSKAFLGAWEAACAWEGDYSRMLIPEGTFFLKPLAFTGPCYASVDVQVRGTVLAPADLGAFPAGKSEWIAFNNVEGLLITGGGTFDGQGASAWTAKDCNTKKTTCRKPPKSIGFNFVKDSTISQITSLNSKRVHISIFACQNLTLQDITITAPGNSPNTDGIHIGSSSGITISASNIGTGDDCISIGPGSRNLSISGVSCGPGHGISVGSLGRRPNEKDVLDISVSNCYLDGTQNGVRVKTWPTSYVLSASNFTFEDIVMNNVKNPIFIDQNYCPRSHCDRQFPSRVKISHVVFKNITGTSASKVAINLSCSELVPCEDVELNEIHLVYGKGKKAAVSSCSNVEGRSVGVVIPSPCL